MRLLSVLLLLVAGCTHCPMRTVMCETRDCWRCGKPYCMWMDRAWHECKPPESPAESERRNAID